MHAKKNPPAQAGSNSGKVLAGITANIRKGLEDRRANMFALGAELLKAEAVIEHGGWLKYLEDEFELSDQTARNWMRAAKLAAKFKTVLNLNLSIRVIHELAKLDQEGDRDDTIKAALAFAKSDRLTVSKLDEIANEFHRAAAVTAHNAGETGAVPEVIPDRQQPQADDRDVPAVPQQPPLAATAEAAAATAAEPVDVSNATESLDDQPHQPTPEPEPKITDEVVEDPANYRTAFMIRADQAIRFVADCQALAASSILVVDEEIVHAVQAVATAWEKFAQQMAATQTTYHYDGPAPVPRRPEEYDGFARFAAQQREFEERRAKEGRDSLAREVAERNRRNGWG